MKTTLRRPHPARALFSAGILLVAASSLPSSAQVDLSVRNPILYVTQVPVTATSNTVVSIGGSHLADTKAAPRGGDLMIRYPDGTIKNLTASAGYGVSDNTQTGDAIAVRDPIVHWSGERALFSMVVGAPRTRIDQSKFHWQVYEVEGLGRDDTPVITRIPGQRNDFNNIQPTYTPADEIIYASDQTLSGDMTHYPARNEQGGISVTGLWSLNRSTMKQKLLDHSPSGSFKPFVDSFGRVVFSRWDHLQRDELALESGAIDYASEAPGAAQTEDWVDIFPEALEGTENSPAHKFDLFIPWTMNQDGTGLLTMNHLGRHELANGANRALKDSNLSDFIPELPPIGPVGTETRAGAYLHISEHLREHGKYVATDAVSSAVSAGRLISFTSPPDKNADTVRVTIASNVGLARDPSYLASGKLMGSFADGPLIFGSYGGGSDEFPITVEPDAIPDRNNPFRVRVSRSSEDLASGPTLIPSGRVTRSNYIDGELVTFNGDLWQLQPVEVIVRPAPPAQSESPKVPEPELAMFGEAGVSPAALKRWLEENELALLVSRNVTARDRNDLQQPYNLVVPGGVSSLADNGPSYQITNLQFFQGDYVRGYTKDAGLESPDGRRVTPRILHADKGENLPTGIPGSAKIAPDGSTAMFVPAGRATTWQLTDHRGDPVVRERYWLTFQAGEIRSCTNCHGNNTADQLDRPTVTNPPLALRTLLSDWNERHPEAEAGVTPYQFWAELNIAPGATPTGDANGDGVSNMEAYAHGLGASGHAASDSVAQPLTPSILKQGGQDYGALVFTLNPDRPLRIVVESSAGLQNWTETAVLKQGELISNDSSIYVSINTNPALTSRGLIQVAIREVTPLAQHSSRYFRLKFEE